MAQFKVYHVVTGKTRDSFCGIFEDVHFPEHYELVAVVEAENIDDCYEKTNHIDSNWCEGNCVVELFKRSRSTSMGDILEDESGKQFRCASVGWDEL